MLLTFFKHKPFLKSSSSFSLTSDLNLVILELERKNVAQEAKKQRLVKVKMNPTPTEAIAPVKSRDFFFRPCRTITRHEKTAKAALAKKCKKGTTIIRWDAEEFERTLNRLDLVSHYHHRLSNTC